MMLTKEEQRVFNRMQLNTKVILATAQSRIEGVCRNLSAQGVLMEVSNGQCQIGEEWQLVVPSADNQVLPLKAMAKVLRVDSGERTDMVALTLTEVR
ncbi:pilus assembly protein PilZ [Oceanisphaera profunda]|uniref:Pilus assembly protein PilZ n=1 Tax=Oceanisphaera profunda TaxID=1416627 RepID=A0A1Y0D3Q6_9GAMM|nr:PilZ domain-containing protein [Oceanisphaera profunda]ART82160.1 pilus assembly protein PilZ [Oceanisphaera profunda]